MTEYADSDFWVKYAAYVDECYSRHVRAISTVWRGTDVRCGWESVLDLGFGRVMEGRRLATDLGSGYFGVDVSPLPNFGCCLAADYRTELDRIATACENIGFVPTVVLSLFSIEPTGVGSLNQSLYHRIFDLFPRVDLVVSSGFYYDGKENHLSVKEAGGLVSFQTTGTLSDTTLFTERRLLERGPSKLFGPDVIEVWRFLTRSRHD